MSEPTYPIVWVADGVKLAELCAACAQMPVVAIDTEFMRTDTYYPIPALIQIFDGQTNYLIDPVAIADLSALRQLLANPATLKVFHSCSEDIEVFLRLFGEAPTPVFDTQIAAAFCGLGYSRGFAALVELLLAIRLPKEETRSDWLARPLREAQLSYAACDVEFLYRLYQILRAKLDASGRYSWALAESARSTAQVEKMQNPELAYTKYKGAWKLAPRGLATLMKLAAWREGVAQQKNLPRSRIVDNKSLFAIAERPPKHVAQLRSIDSLRDSAIRRYGTALVEQVLEVQAMAEDALPQALIRPSREDQKRLKLLREIVDRIALDADIAPEMLANRRDLESLYLAGDTNGAAADELAWRAPLIERAHKEFHEKTAL